MKMCSQLFRIFNGCLVLKQNSYTKRERERQLLKVLSYDIHSPPETKEGREGSLISEAPELLSR